MSLQYKYYLIFPLKNSAPRVSELYGLGFLCLKVQIPSTKLQINLRFQYSMTRTGLKNDVQHRTLNVQRRISVRLRRFNFIKKWSEATPTFDVRSAGGGQVLARLWRVERSMFDVHLFSV